MAIQVKALRSFYHDSIGNKTAGEVFEVPNQDVFSQLDQSGYVEKAEQAEAQAQQNNQDFSTEMGQELAHDAHEVHNTQETQNARQARNRKG